VKEGRRGYFAGQREDRAVRNHMVTFADIGKMTDRELQVLLEVVDRKDLVVSLKAAAEELKDKILGNMSEEARAFISAEMKELGPMRLSEVEEVQLRIVQQVRQLEEQGKLTIIRGDAGQMC
jgi:flagellar motor switch protein FliG